MKKIILLLILNFGAFACVKSSYGFSVHLPKNPAKLNSEWNVRADQLVKLSSKQFSALTGKKMILVQRFSFNFLKIRMKHDLKKDPNLTLQDYYGSAGKRLGTGWIILIAVVAVLLILALIAAASLSRGWQ